MKSHATMIAELPAPKEVSIVWDLNLSASSSSQDVPRLTRIRDRQSATSTPSYRCCPDSSIPSSASCTTLSVHRSSPGINSVELKVQLPTLQTTVRHLMTPCAPHRGSLIVTIPRPGQHCQCSKLLLLIAIRRLFTCRQALRQHWLLGLKKRLPLGF